MLYCLVLLLFLFSAIGGYHSGFTQNVFLPCSVSDLISPLLPFLSLWSNSVFLFLNLFFNIFFFFSLILFLNYFSFFSFPAQFIISLSSRLSNWCWCMQLFRPVYHILQSCLVPFCLNGSLNLLNQFVTIRLLMKKKFYNVLNQFN